MAVILLTSSAVLWLTCTSYFTYEYITYRNTSVRQLSLTGEIMAAGCAPFLSSGDKNYVAKLLATFKADPHLLAAILYDEKGIVFSAYPSYFLSEKFAKPTHDYYRFEESYLVGFQPILKDGKRIGTLYLKSDVGGLYDLFKLYGIIALSVILLSTLLAYFLSKNLQREISHPILALADLAKVVSEKQDYTVRAEKQDDNEVGVLTDAFNQMLIQIQSQTLQIRSFNQKLEDMVIARTDELEAANKELEAFTYSVSHDLRAPLRSIHGYMNIFLEEYAGQFDAEANRLMSVIVNNSKKMGLLIDDLLEFSRLSRSELSKSNISMHQMVLNICEELKRADEKRNIEFNVHELPEAYADNITIRQVWTNLIGNAIKYTGHKEKSVIEIGSEKRGTVTTYYVKDNGAGFDMRYYDKLFGVFQRLHSQKDFEGTGVGLAIVHRIITKHGGKVWATAQLNEGATFYFTLEKKQENFVASPATKPLQLF